MNGMRLSGLVEWIDETSAEDVALLLVGDGPAKASRQARIRQRGIQDKVTMTGVIGHDKVPVYLGVFDIAVQPSAVEYACPLKIIEYMAAGWRYLRQISPIYAIYLNTTRMLSCLPKTTYEKAWKRCCTMRHCVRGWDRPLVLPC